MFGGDDGGFLPPAQTWSYNGTTLRNGMMEVKCDFCGLTQWRPKDMRILIVTLAALLSGCATVAGHLPSLQYCDHVTYTRNGNQFTLHATCSAPIGNPGLP